MSAHHRFADEKGRADAERFNGQFATWRLLPEFEVLRSTAEDGIVTTPSEPVMVNGHPVLVDQDGDDWVWNGAPERTEGNDDGYDLHTSRDNWVISSRSRDTVENLYNATVKMTGDDGVADIEAATEPAEPTWTYEDLKMGDMVRHKGNGSEFLVISLVKGDILDEEDDVLKVANLPSLERDQFSNASSVSPEHYHLIEGGGLEALQMQVTALEQRVAQATETHVNDMQKVSERLIREATTRSWCSDYDDIIDDLNPSLQVSLNQRRNDLRAEITVTRTITETVYIDVDNFQAGGHGDEASRIAEFERMVKAGSYNRQIQRASDTMGVYDEFEIASVSAEIRDR